jgi:hypothetical protein
MLSAQLNLKIIGTFENSKDDISSLFTVMHIIFFLHHGVVYGLQIIF